jgi:hypothetical protein
LAEGRTTAALACRVCGTELLENARFCHECGALVGDADTHAEYKQVTVLFADVCIRWASPRRWVRSGCAKSW